MRIAPIALGVALLVGCMPPGLHVQDVALVSGVPVVDVYVNGLPGRCVVDTGYPNFAISQRFGGTPWVGFGQPEPTAVEMIVAGWAFTGAAVTLSDGIFEDAAQAIGAQGVDCILGAAFLTGLQLTVDYANRRIELLDGAGRVMRPGGTHRDPVEDPLLYDGWGLVGSATVDDALTGVFLYGSAAPRVVLTEDALADLPEPPEVDEHGRGTLGAFEVAGSRVEDVPFEVGSSGWLTQLSQETGLRVDGVVGASFLAAHVVTWDWVEGRMVLRRYDDRLLEDTLSGL